jgi:hypothetical protein
VAGRDRRVTGRQRVSGMIASMIRRRLLIALATAPLLAPRLALAAEEKKKGGGLDFIQIPTMTATITKRDGRRGVLTVETGVDVPDHRLHDLAEASTPRLRAAYAQVLMTYAAQLSPGSPPNADYLSRELQRQTDLVLGKPGAKLLLGAILIN